MFFEIAYAADASTKPVVNMGAWHSIMSASFTVQLTLIILIAMSLVSWAIIITKKKQFKLLKNANDDFLDLFWKAKSLDEIYDNIAEHESSSLSHIFRAGYQELRKIADSGLANKELDTHSPMLSGIDNLQRAISKSEQIEIEKMENQLSFLATTGSTGPFIGLFGTVWGIMGSFQKIAATNMASLAVVAPGISEALIATAIGLVTAIPATVGYNNFISKIKKQETEINSFSSDFLNIVKRNFFKGN